MTNSALMYHRDGHTPVIVASGLTRQEAMEMLIEKSRSAGQPVLDDGIVNESAENGCGYYYVQTEGQE